MFPFCSQVPCASTLCIINLQQTEAKVEALFDSFMSLREQTSSKGNSAEEGQNLFMFDDDENYQARTSHLPKITRCTTICIQITM